nr:MAG TPA: hypothetical protein [Siphoviridae sp. ctedi74]
MRTEEILAALRRLKVETGSLVCMGCGREHDCGIHGCRIVREAADLIEKLTDRCARYAEEIADVGIMLDQMAIEFEVEDAVAEQRAYKVRRLRSRLEYVEQEG